MSGNDVALVQRMVAGVPLGPPSRTLQRVVGGAIGIPIGIGIVLPPHGLLIGIGGAGLLAYAVGATALAIARMRRFATENNLAIGALGRGELAQASEVLVRWARDRHPMISATARHNLGWTLMLEGRVEDATRILEDAAAHHDGALIRTALLPTTRLDIALCHALLGHLELAEAWCAKAALPVKAPPQPTFPGMMAVLRGVIDCRRGRSADAVVALEHAWDEHEATMTGEILRLMRVVRAFACAASEGPRHQGHVERVLGDLRPRYAYEFAFLGGRWPEMAAFLAAHQLDR